MKVQLLSDLHIEFKEYLYPDCDSDVVVLAGDIHTKTNGFKWALESIKNKSVIYVLGNHEFYGKAYPKLIADLKSVAKGTNVHILENDTITLEGVNFMGCTLWTDFELFGSARLSGYECQQIMTDYKKIKRSPQYSKVRSIDLAVINKHSTVWLAEELEKHSNETNIVVTHHGPSITSVPEWLRDDQITPAYVSDMVGFIEKYKPQYWLHGHLHNSSDYVVDKCRVLCNPKGYPGEENPSFNPQFCFPADGAITK